MRKSIQDIATRISQLFDNPGENVNPISLGSDSIANKELSSLFEKLKIAVDWDEQLSILQVLMSYIKGGGCEYPSFVQNIGLFLQLLIDCVLNMRSTLVKYGCLCISMLSKALGILFETQAESLLPVLFQPTTNGTSIISVSCKCTIICISKNCHSRKVLSSLLFETNSKSQIRRSIVSEALHIVSSQWPIHIISQNISQLSSSLNQLTLDACLDARNWAKDSIIALQDRGVLSTQNQVEPEKKKFVIPNSRKTNRGMNVIPQSETEVLIKSNTPAGVTQIIKPTKPIAQSITESKISMDTIQNLFETNDESSLNKAYKYLIDNIEKNISEFSKFFDNLVPIIIRHSCSSSFMLNSNATTLLRIIAKHFKGTELLNIALQSKDRSTQLLSFTSNIVRNDPSVLEDQSICNNVLSLCCEIYSNNHEQRFAALSIGLLNKSKSMNPNEFNRFAKNTTREYRDIIISLHLFDDIEIDLKKPLVSNDQVLEWVKSSKDWNKIIDNVVKNKMVLGESTLLAIYSELYKSEYFEDINTYMNDMLPSMDSKKIIQISFNMLKNSPSTNTLALLTNVLPFSSPSELVTIKAELCSLLKDKLISVSWEDRMYAVMCYSSIHKAIGASLADLPCLYQRIIEQYSKK